MASLVLFSAVLLATMSAIRARASASSPSSGTTWSSSSRLAVSVPVLSTQSVSTWLSDSTALACWTSAP
jgi:anti-sigma factor RsiW